MSTGFYLPDDFDYDHPVRSNKIADGFHHLQVTDAQEAEWPLGKDDPEGTPPRKYLEVTFQAIAGPSIESHFKEKFNFDGRDEAKTRQAQGRIALLFLRTKATSREELEALRHAGQAWEPDPAKLVGCQVVGEVRRQQQKNQQTGKYEDTIFPALAFGGLYFLNDPIVAEKGVVIDWDVAAVMGYQPPSEVEQAHHAASAAANAGTNGTSKGKNRTTASEARNKAAQRAAAPPATAPKPATAAATTAVPAGAKQGQFDDDDI